MRQILFYPNKGLRKKNEPVERVDNDLISQIAEIGGMLTNSPNGAGLAAPQVGINKRFFVTKEMGDKKIMAMINPGIIKTMGEKEFPMIKSDKEEWENFLEGCLSFPNIWGMAKRYLKIRAKWQEIENKKLVWREAELGGFEAIVFQHELDHLEGVLFTDRIRESNGKVYRQIGEEMREISIRDFV